MTAVQEHYRKRDMVRQLRALGARPLQFRVVTRVDQGSKILSARRGSQTGAEKVASGLLAGAIDLEGLADLAYGTDLHVAADSPSGLVTLTGITADGVERLTAIGIEPCCVVRGPPDRLDAWVQLATSEAEIAEQLDRAGAVPVRLVLTVAAQRLTALAGGDPRTAHYAQGGFVAGVYQAWSQGDVKILFATDRLAAARAGLLAECAGLARSIEAAAEIAAAAGVDPEREVEALVATGDLGVALDALYRRQAAVASFWGVTDSRALDRSVAAAAARLGAPQARVRALLRAGSPLRGTNGFANHLTTVIEEVFSDPTTIYAASKTGARSGRTASAGEVLADGRGVAAGIRATTRRATPKGSRGEPD